MSRSIGGSFALLALAVVLRGESPRSTDDKGPPPAVRKLLDKIAKGEPKEAVAAIEAMEKIKGASKYAAPALIEALNEGGSDVSNTAIYALARVGEPALMPLIEALDDPKLSRRANSAWALSELDHEQRSRETPGWERLYGRRYEREIRPLLLAGLKHKNKEWREAAYDSLLAHEDTALLPDLFRAAADAKAPKARAEAFDRLGMFTRKPDKVVLFLAAAIENSKEPFDDKEDSSPVRTAAFAALRILDEGATPAFRRFFQSADERLVLLAAHECAGRRCATAADLIRLLRHGSYEIRNAAIDCIESLKNHDALTAQCRVALRGALGDAHPQVRLSAAYAVHRSVNPGDGSAVKVAVDLLRKAETDEGWSSALQLLREMGRRAATAEPYLVRAFGTPTRRADAALALSEVLPAKDFDKRIFPKVLAMLKAARGEEEARTLIYVVERMGPRAKTAAPLLVRFLADDDIPAVQGAALEALAATGTKDAICVQAARRLLKSQDKDLRGKAEAALTALTKSSR